VRGARPLGTWAWRRSFDAGPPPSTIGEAPLSWCYSPVVWASGPVTFWLVSERHSLGMASNGHGEKMRTNVVLVDYENVQPKDLGLLKDGPFKVKVFLGPTQSKVPVALASALQPLGSNAEYVELEAAGNNALDFHIAYYIGVLSSEDPAAFFHIISKDTGFDSLIRHLKGRKIFAQRSSCIADIPCFKPTLPATAEAQVEVVVADLIRRKASKPRTQKTLLSTLHALFKKELSEQQLSQLLTSLCSRGVVKLDGARVSYSLPIEP